MRFDRPFFLFFLLSFMLWGLAYAQEDVGTGAFIVVSKEGEVKVHDADQQQLPDAASAVGKTLLQGQTIQTGASGKIILLLSTGTLTTVQPGSEFVLEKFVQKPFEQDPNQTVGDLEAEPSTSDVHLKLGYGAVVFNVKKLNTGSSFVIDSPVGSAGIRGTDGQLEVTMDPNTGTFAGGVNMLNGSVDFQTVDGVSFLVNPGQAIFSQVSVTGRQIGQIERRPVPPEMTQQLNQGTNLAKDSSKDVRVGNLNQARQEAVQRFKVNSNKSGEEKKDQSQEGNQPDRGGENRKSETQNEKSGSSQEGREPLKSANSVRANIQKRLGNGGENNQDTEKLMEVDDQADLAQLGIVLDKENARKLQNLGLGKDDVTELSQSNLDELKALLQEENATERDANIRNQIIRTKVAKKIQNYVNKERLILEQFSIEIQFKLLNKIEPGQITALQEFTSPENLLIILPVFAESDKTIKELATFLENKDTESLIGMGIQLEVDGSETNSITFQELLILLRENSNEDIIQSLMDLADDSDEETLIELGLQSNELLSDIISSDTLSFERIWVYEELWENPFYRDPLMLASSFFENADLSKVFTYGSRNLSIEADLDLSEIYQTQQQSRFLVTALDSIQLSGEVDISTGAVEQKTYLSLIAGDALNFENNSKLNFAGDHLHIGSSGSMEIVSVSMEAGSSLEIQTMDDLVLRNSSLIVRGGDEINLQAATTLQLNSVNFSENVREIYLQAITIDLRNINFPGGSTVNLASQLGGINGKYPTFPTGDSSNLLGNRQIGRVNFIENVKYNENLLNNRLQFDQFGQNIHISTLQP